MTGNQRRPGFRLPWSADTDEGPEPDAGGRQAPAVDAEASAPPASAPAASAAAASAPTAAGEAPSARADEARPAEPTTAAEPASAPTESAGKPEAPTNGSAQPAPTAPAAPSARPETESSTEFMRDLVAAMRAVAEDARRASVEELRTKTDEQVRRLEEDAQRRQEQLRARSEADVAGIGEWAKAEAERIKAEAEQRVVARKALLDQQLAADATRNEAETKALRDRVSEYERELEAYHSQLAEINDPAAFAAAAKRMPRPPQLAHSSAEPKVEPTVEAPAAPASAPGSAESNGSPAAGPQVHPAEEEVLASRLAELDAAIPADAPATEPRDSSEPMTTEIVVKGLGSFGAITGFRQALASVEGVAGVALSLGQTGEFVFRATHAPGFDVRAAIVSLEGDGATIEDRAEGGLRVTLERAR